MKKLGIAIDKSIIILLALIIGGYGAVLFASFFITYFLHQRPLVILDIKLYYEGLAYIALAFIMMKPLSYR